ncbi:major facilitator superfamily domain-containing protein [Aspergillus spectabilis]
MDNDKETSNVSAGPENMYSSGSASHSLRWWGAVGSIIFLYSMSLGSHMCLAGLTSLINADIGPRSLSDVVGRRWFCIGTGLLGMLSGIIGGVAQNIPTVIVAYAVLGLNQAGAMNSLAAANELVSRRNRGYLVGVMNACSIFWVICGHYLGRRITVDTDPGWRSFFWLTLATNAVGTVVIAATYFPEKALAVIHGHSYQSWLEIDWIGLTGIIIGPTLFLVGIINVPNYGAKDAHFLGPFITGTVTTALLGVYEAYLPQSLPFLFRRVRSFVSILVVAFVGGMLLYSLQAWFPIYLETVLGRDEIQVGVDTMPMNSGVNVGGFLSGILLPSLGPRIGTTSILSFGVVLQFILMCIPGIHDRAMALVFSTIAGFGIGIVELFSILLIQLAAPDEWIGFATGALGLLRMMGGSTGTAIYTAGLDPAVIPQLLAHLSEGEEAASSPIEGVTEAILHNAGLAMREAYRDSFKYIWLSSIAFAVISLACALATKDLSSFLTNDVAQQLEEPGDKNSEKEQETGSVEQVEKVDI